MVVFRLCNLETKTFRISLSILVIKNNLGELFIYDIHYVDFGGLEDKI